MVSKLTGGKAAPTPAQADLIGQMEAAKQKLKDIQEQLGQANDYTRYLSMEDQVKKAETEQLAGAQIEMLTAYIDMLQTGQWDPAGAATKQDPAEVQTALNQMEPGWNDMQGQSKLFDETKNADGSTNPEADPAITDLGPLYAGSIMLENSGAYDPASSLASNALAFIADDHVTSITGKTVGTDVHLQVIKDDGSVKVYVLKNMAVRPEPIYIYAGNNTLPITIDLSRVARVADGNWGQPFGTTNGFMIFGGQGNDKIYGSAGGDVIAGGAGDDQLHGLNGIDQMYGDEVNDDGAAGFRPTDGNDLIDGGAGKDIIRAGGGSQDTVWNATTDASVSEQESPGMGVQYNAADAQQALKSLDPSYQATTAPDGTLVIDHKANLNGGDFQLAMPDGYNIAAAEQGSSDQSLLITMTKLDGQGVAQTIHIRVKNFFDPNNKGTLTFVGNNDHNMIDFSNITLGGQQINFIGLGGDDVILAPKSGLDDTGLSLAELGTGTVDNSELTSLLTDGQKTFTKTDGTTVVQQAWGLTDPAFGNLAEPNPETPASWLHWSNNTDAPSAFLDDKPGTINLTLSDQSIQDFLAHGGKPEDLQFNFAMPADYDDVYLVNRGHIEGSFDASGVDQTNYQLVFVKHTADGIERVVVNLGNMPTQATIVVGGVPPKTIAGAPVTITGNPGSGENPIEYGTDTVFGSAASIETHNAAGAHLLTGTYEADYTVAGPTNQSQTAKKQDLESQQAELVASQTALESDLQSQQTTLDGSFDDIPGDPQATPADKQAFNAKKQSQFESYLAEAKKYDNLSQEQWLTKLQSTFACDPTDPADDDLAAQLEVIASELVAYADDYHQFLADQDTLNTVIEQIQKITDKQNGK